MLYFHNCEFAVHSPYLARSLDAAYKQVLLLRQHSRHTYGTSVLCATLAAFLCHMHSLLWLAGIKYTSQKEMFFAKLRITTPAVPLLHAYQGGFFFSFPKSLNLNADSLRWFSSPKPRFVLPPIGGKLGAYPICRVEYRQAVAGMEGVHE